MFGLEQISRDYYIFLFEYHNRFNHIGFLFEAIRVTWPLPIASDKHLAL
jgi:hypothetical protein